MEGKELVKEWCKGRYPMMAEDDDYGELDCHDMFVFAEWLFLKLNKPDVIKSLPLDFVKWYSGIEEVKILKAFERWKKESERSIIPDENGKA